MGLLLLDEAAARETRVLQLLQMIAEMAAEQEAAVAAELGAVSVPEAVARRAMHGREARGGLLEECPHPGEAEGLGLWADCL